MNNDNEKNNISARDVWRKKNGKYFDSGRKTQNGQAAEAAGGEYAPGESDEYAASENRKRDYMKGQGLSAYSYNGSGVEDAFVIDSGGGRKYNRPLMIFLIILASIFAVAFLFRVLFVNFTADGEMRNAAGIGKKHIGVLYIEGTIGSSDGQYNHQYVIDTLDGMMENRNNRGLILYVNTPGGGVYESDEVYMKIKEYQETTGRPVYSYMASQATSGGYYISAPADRILANRNCWTGSIGVTMGTLFDISGLLEKYGIKSETITSGANKSMGSMTEPMTEQQRQIMQSMIDEAYEQFVGIVAEGRDLSVDYVKSISDGRIYTAKQAKDIRLVDEVVNTYDEALEMMRNDCGLYDCEVYNFRYEREESLLGSFIESIDKLAGSAESGDISALIKLMEKQNELPLQYMCEVRK